MIPNAQTFWSRKMACYLAMERVIDIRDRSFGRRRAALNFALLRLLNAAARWHKAYLCALRLGRND
jgi:hypothetical protein